MNGTDPSPQDVALEKSLFTQHKVKVFLYNQQVTDSLTESFISWRTPAASRSSASTRPCRPRLRLPVLDARRGQRPAQGRDRQGLDGAPVMAGRPADLLRATRVGDRLWPSASPSSRAVASSRPTAPTGRSGSTSASSPPGSSMPGLGGARPQRWPRRTPAPPQSCPPHLRTAASPPRAPARTGGGGPESPPPVRIGFSS